MKAKILYLSITSLVCLSTIGYGQMHPVSLLPLMDSIQINIDNELAVTISNCDYSKIKDQLNTDLNQLMQIVIKDYDQFESEKSYIIDYVPQSKLSFQPSDKVEKIIFEKNKPRVDYKNQCRINSSNYNADIRFNKVESLVDTSNINDIIKVFDSLPDKNRHAYSYNFSIDGGKINSLKHLDHRNGDMDFISLEFGAGAGIVKNQLTTDLSAKFALQFNTKGHWKNQFYVSNNLMFMFDDNDKVKLNHFLNLGYRNNFSSDRKKTNWIGVELGYLTNRNGDFFGKNTLRFSVNWDIGRYMSISPSLYMTDNFTTFYPGIRLGIGF